MHSQSGVLQAGAVKNEVMANGRPRYESPFKDIAPQGPEELFSDEKVINLIDTIKATSNPNADSAVA
jgi:hypothetical protein